MVKKGVLVSIDIYIVIEIYIYIENCSSNWQGYRVYVVKKGAIYVYKYIHVHVYTQTHNHTHMSI